MHPLFLPSLACRDALGTMYPTLTIIVLFLCTFFTCLIIMNLIITLMNDLYSKIKENQEYVFQRNRAGGWRRSRGGRRSSEADGARDRGGGGGGAILLSIWRQRRQRKRNRERERERTRLSSLPSWSPSLPLSSSHKLARPLSPIIATELVLEVESTMSTKDCAKFRNIPPYLHLLRPVNLEDREKLTSEKLAQESGQVALER
jgi:hypothetical protein